MEVFVRAVNSHADLERMLANLLDAHYGASLHDIGSGDGLNKEEADELRQWWEQRLQSAREPLGRVSVRS